MLNFSCEYKNLKLDKNLNIYQNGKKECLYYRDVSAKDCKQFTETIKKAALKAIEGKSIFDLPLKDLGKAVKQIEKLRSILISVRLTHIFQYKSKEQVQSELNGFVNGTFYGDEYDRSDDFSPQEKIVINELTNDKLYYFISSSDFYELYDPVKNSTKEMEKLLKEYKDFDYKSYGLKQKDIEKKIQEKYDKVTRVIEAYNFIVSQAGDELADWSDQKISRRLNDNFTGISKWNISSWLDEYKKANKLKPTPKKAKKQTRCERLEARYLKHEELTQEEIFTLFKQSKDYDGGVVSQMTWETIAQVMDSKLKGVQEKVKGKGYSTKGHKYVLIARAMKVLPKTKKAFKKLIDFAYEHNIFSSITWEFVSEYEDLFNKDLLLAFTRHRDTYDMIGASDKVIERLLSENTIHAVLDSNKDLTKEYVKRLDTEERVRILPRLGGEFIKSQENATKFILTCDEWDNIKDVTFNSEDLVELYQNVPWGDIKHYLMSNRRFSLSVIPLVIKNKDTEFAMKLLKELHSSLEESDKLTLMKFFNREDHINVIINSLDEKRTYNNHSFQECAVKLFDTEEAVHELVEAMIDYGKDDNDYIDLCYSIAKKRKFNLSINEVIKSKERIEYFNISSTANKYLDKETKVHLIKATFNLTSESQYSNYRYRTEGLKENLVVFFKDLTREELLEGFDGVKLTDNKFTNYLSKQMTMDERITAVQRDHHFLRVNLDDLSYEYLKQYEDKKAFKDLVGDRRTPANNKFAISLTKKLEENLKKKLNPSNSVKMMFAS